MFLDVAWGDDGAASADIRRLISAGSRDSRITLVLDDLHVLPAQTPLHQALADAVRDDTDDIRLVLVSREAQHPAWLRLNAIGKAAVIDVDMLKLNEAEAGSVIRNYRDSNLVNGMIQMGRRNCLYELWLR